MELDQIQATESCNVLFFQSAALKNDDIVTCLLLALPAGVIARLVVALTRPSVVVLWPIVIGIVVAAVAVAVVVRRPRPGVGSTRGVIVVSLRVGSAAGTGAGVGRTFRRHAWDVGVVEKRVSGLNAWEYVKIEDEGGWRGKGRRGKGGSVGNDGAV